MKLKYINAKHKMAGGSSGAPPKDWDSVMIDGIASRPELNGLTGTVVGFMDNGRYDVLITRDPATRKPNRLSIKRANLKTISITSYWRIYLTTTTVGWQGKWYPRVFDSREEAEHYMTQNHNTFATADAAMWVIVAPNKEPPSMANVGDIVQLHGIQSKPELNGLQGQVITVLPTFYPGGYRRYTVQIPGQPPFSINETNLKPAVIASGYTAFSGADGPGGDDY
ncbi:MAG: hypothetical protein CL728_04455 [Chloroflexi bacterium]|nr:hypothetical protein [Chloroflexota bacterium]